jgi:hypothetical protein
MHKRSVPLLLVTAGFFIVASGQELSVSTAAKTYAAGEQVWVNLSVLGASAIPGAYKIKVNYDAGKLTFSSILPAKQGPFSVTPAASAAGGGVTVAGFQGIVDSGSGNTSLVTLVFTPAGGSAVIDTASFAIGGKEVYSASAQVMDLKVSRQSTSVHLPSAERSLMRRIVLTNNYLRFPVVKEGLTSMQLFDLSGRVCAVPLSKAFCKAGYHAVPIGKSLGRGIYIVKVLGAGLCVTERVEVLQ